ncbi:MAG: LysR family transcriptional regulator [Betaproteobacteria bacterium]|nr:LysR family transcriptional regulator [Betaproteobacteria bacterium]
MNLRDLRYLVAIADYKHFGRAADACFVSQPTLSTQLKKIESELGASLIERNPRNVILTAVGEAVVARARIMLREADEIRKIAKQAKAPESGAIRLGLFPTLGPYLLPHVIPGIVQRFPDLELILVEEKSETILRKLHEGSLDAGILALPIQDDSLQAEFLFQEPFFLAVHQDNRLAKAQQITPDDLIGENLLLLDEGHCLRDQALQVCRLSGAIERSGFRATSLETLRHMVSAKVGMTLLPALTVYPPAQTVPGLVLVPFEEPVPHRRIALVWRRSSALTAFFDQLAPLLRNIPAEAFSIHRQLSKGVTSKAGQHKKPAGRRVS